ncbi:MAG: hypothetical protein IKC82_02095 [Lentisphaeria bacterium]|nr:hypothetical protein [Lentisphaeria bacterium]
MKKLSLLLTAAVSLVPSLSYAVSEQDSIIAELKKAPPYIRKAERTSTFSQAQLKYGLGTVSYYPAWIDRPLFVDPELAPAGYEWRRGELIQLPDLKRRYQIMKDYSMTGVSFFYYNIPRENHRIMPMVGEVGNFKMLPLISGNEERVGKAIADVIGRPYIYRIKNKPVVVVNIDPSAEFYNRWKDKCYLVTTVHSSILITRRYNDGKMTRKDVEDIKALIRKRLKTADGILWFSPHSTTVKGYRKIAVEFQRDVLYPINRIVFAEAAHKDKLLAGRVTFGHENAYGYGYYEGSDGMGSAIAMFQSALDNNVEFINQNEWDEQNENTSSRPTVYNSLAYMRLWRYFASRFNNSSNEPLAHDDSRVPPFIFSARKKLTLGERLQLQLLHIPTAQWQAPYSVKVTLRDMHGKVVYTSDEYRFAPDKLRLERIYLPSEKFALTQALIPEITVDCGTKRTFTGLHPVELKPLHNNDFKFVHNPLRDLLQIKYRWQIKPDAEKGFFRTDVKVDSAEKLAVVELLEGSECLYAHGATAPDGRENDKQWAIQIQPWGVKYRHHNGVVRLKNAPPAKGFISYPLWSHPAPPLVNNEWKIINFTAFPPYMVMMIDKAGSENAVIEVDYPGVPKQEIPLKELLAKRTYSIGGPDGFSLGLIRQVRQITHPKLLKSKTAEFSAGFAPVNHRSMILLQAVAENGMIWRSTPRFPVPPAKPQELKAIRVWSETFDRSVIVRVPAELVPDLHISTDKSYGSIVPTGENRASWGIRGGFTEQFLEHGGMDGTYGNELCKHLNWPPEYRKQWPKREDDFIPENDGAVWKFNGLGSHLQFTQELIPRRGDYTLEFEVNPADVKKHQILFVTTPCFWMQSYLWNLTMLPGGELRMYIGGEALINSGLRLKPGVWSKVRIHNFRDSGVLFEVNGVKNFIPVKFKPFINIANLVIGGRFTDDYKRRADRYFKGEMRNIAVKYGIPAEYEIVKSGNYDPLISPEPPLAMMHETWSGGSKVTIGSEEDCVKLVSGKDVYSTTSLRVKPNSWYRIKGKFRGTPGRSRFYFGVVMVDQHKRIIQPHFVNAVRESETVLSRPASAGDTVIYVKDGKNWKAGTAYTAFHTGRDLKDLPNFSVDSNRITAVEKKDGVWQITYAKGIKFSAPAGSGVRLHKGAAFGIFAAAYAPIPAEWKEFSTIVRGSALAGASKDQWWAGTRAVRFVVMFIKRDAQMPLFEFRDFVVEEVKPGTVIPKDDPVKKEVKKTAVTAPAKFVPPKWIGGGKVTPGSEDGAEKLLSGSYLYTNIPAPVDPAAKYCLSGKFKGDPAARSRFYFGVVMLDANGKQIQPQFVSPVAGSDTQLAKDVKSGDTVIWLKDGRSWASGAVNIAFFAGDGFADLPNNKISSCRIISAGQEEGMWKITLDKGVKYSAPAGTKVRLHHSGAFGIFAASYRAIPAEWQEFKLELQGITPSGTPKNQWWRGTKSARIVIMFNKRDARMPLFEFRDLKLEKIN